MLPKCRVNDRQEFLGVSLTHNNLIFCDCAMDREAVVASIVALLFCHSVTRKIAVSKLALVDF